MKKISNTLMKAAATASASALSAAAFAETEFKGFNEMVSDANTTVTQAGLTVINFASIIIGLIAVVMLIWNFIKRSKGDQSSADALTSWGFGLIFAALGLQIVKFIFFGGNAA